MIPDIPTVKRNRLLRPFARLWWFVRLFRGFHKSSLPKGGGSGFGPCWRVAGFCAKTKDVGLKQ